jgi:two-component system, chemotaxis family, sensor kinase CheA
MSDTETLLKELMETFRLEAQDHVSALPPLLVALENESDPGERKRLLDTIFRRMHTLKGAAHAVNLTEVAKGCQDLENLLADLKRGDLALDLGLFDRLHTEIDALSEQIFAPAAGGLPGGDALPEAGERRSAEAFAESALFPAGPKPAPSGNGQPAENPQPAVDPAAAAADPQLPLKPEAKPETANGLSGAPAGDMVRVSTRLLESLLLQAEELVSAKLTASVLLEEVAEAAVQLLERDGQRARSLDLARETLRHCQPDEPEARLAALLEESCQQERHTESRLRALEKSAEKHLRALGGMVDPLLEDVKKLHLLPFSSLTDPFAKLVRDLGRELGKEATFRCLGGGVEMDRRILAELKEPLLHIVRNMMDHGMEKPAERRLRGKKEKGEIRIEVRLQDANRAEVAVIDDGRGIDLDQVKRAALRLELIAPEALERISDPEAMQLVFEPGISTSPIITSLSGRGVGLAIVRESLERLGGHAVVDSRPGRGTEFRLCLPLSFSMMRGLLVESGGRPCILPAANVELTVRVSPEEIRRVENRETVLVGDQVISLVSLARVLELEHAGAENPDGMQPVVLLNAADRRIAFAVDQVVGVQEILVKPLGRQLSRVRNVAGATVLGSGRVVPILNVGDLFRSALSGAAGAVLAPTRGGGAGRRLSVLVAEDSITSRTLLKNILESSGFLVKTAIDGADAFSQLKIEEFDIVISDVEMPRMDGFQLTEAIRADGRWDALPVVLVTGLESRSDRERGIDVGANAYVVKSSFDQGSLIEIIQKLT